MSGASAHPIRFRESGDYLDISMRAWTNSRKRRAAFRAEHPRFRTRYSSQPHTSTPLLEKTNRQNDDYYQYGDLNPNLLVSRPSLLLQSA
jgi:hypothetical protein